MSTQELINTCMLRFHDKMQFRNRSYFRLPSIPWMVIVFSSFGIMAPSLVFAPHMVPLQYFGPVGPLYRFLIRTNTWNAVMVSALLLHASEAIYSWYLCRRKGIEGLARVKWFVSTAVFGGASLYELHRYNPVANEAD
ncbi:uncharacterized protein LOC110983570 isoform X7 [Acanthaster planci]|uniref:Transmembrane protein 254 n=1 Tax=Acanthaster planci TaxID=133434 RepID=A0A8B7YZ31_ACAPL|nr:uncharacterized protein LOC110983570 isoform X7 [Acanthaster planci]